MANTNFRAQGLAPTRAVGPCTSAPPFKAKKKAGGAV